MNPIDGLLTGFTTVLTPGNLLLAFLGCVLGMLVGILPGFGPAAASAILLPVTFALGPTGAIIVLAAILYGASYGGTVTAVLLNVPGEASSVATTLDGHQMALKGRAGPALSVAAIGSFVGCIVGLIGFVIATPLSKFALLFGPPELFAVTIFGLSIVTGLAGRSLKKALISAAIGLAVALPGLDPVSGAPRFTFQTPELFDGLSFVAVVMGLFGISELLNTIDRNIKSGRALPVGKILPTRHDLRQSAAPIGRGTLIGFAMGLLPGSPGAAASFLSYVTEKKFSKNPEKFGKGAIEGVAGPETTNNSMAISGMIPLFALGLPTSATTAIMLGAFTINGLVPGPLLFDEHPDVAWAIIASMFVGNVILLFLNIPLVRVWVLFLKLPYPVLYGIVLGFMLLGAYSLENSIFNVGVMLAFGVLGYLLRKIDVPLAPMALTIVLGQLMERSFRQSLAMSEGSPSVFVSTPLAAILLTIAVLALVYSAVRPALARRVRIARILASDEEVLPTPTATTTDGNNK
jgi:putative tricarboxylic transport membrane protein